MSGVHGRSRGGYVAKKGGGQAGVGGRRGVVGGGIPMGGELGVEGQIGVWRAWMGA